MIIINIPRRWRPLWALGACGTWWGAPLRRWGATSGRYNAPPMCLRHKRRGRAYFYFVNGYPLVLGATFGRYNTLGYFL